MDAVDQEKFKKKQEIKKIMTEKYSLPPTPAKNGKKNLDLKLISASSNAYCHKCNSGIKMDAGSLEIGSISDEDRGMIDNNYDDQESIDPALLVDKLSPLEKAILDKIREINVTKVLEENPKDIEIIRSNK